MPLNLHKKINVAIPLARAPHGNSSPEAVPNVSMPPFPFPNTSGELVTTTTELLRACANAATHRLLDHMSR